MNALQDLVRLFGPMDFVTQPEPFSYTSYYEKEMGGGLLRVYGSFESLVDPETLPEIKWITNEMEERTAVNGCRRVNIDPGLLSEERLVLATGKNYTHRIYLRKGIYADLTLIFRNGAYRALPWTYPDYADPRTRYWFGLMRGILLVQRGGRIPSRKPKGMEEMD